MTATRKGATNRTATSTTVRAAPAPPPAAEPMTLAFNVRVTAVRQLSPNFRRITFGGYSLRNFGVRGNTLDLRIKLMIPSVGEDGATLPLPVFRTDQPGWYQEWMAMDPGTRGSMRTYTVRQERLDAVYPEIDVDFVLHFDAEGNGGPAANWALHAKPGDAITLIGPNNRAAHCVTAETYAGIEWRLGLAQRVLLAGDETAVPAISAILESLPGYLSGHAILEVPEARDFQSVTSAADVEITWLARGAAIGLSRPHGSCCRRRSGRPSRRPAGSASVHGATPPDPSPRRSTWTRTSCGKPRPGWIPPRWPPAGIRTNPPEPCRSTRGLRARPVWSRRCGAI